MPTAHIPPKDSQKRARDLNSFYRQGHGNSLDILQADFGGDWPPADLTITRPPERSLHFKTYFSLSSTAAYVDNTERDFVIHMNRQHMLEGFFTKASRNIADLVSHENIHILQKVLIRQGLCDSFGRGGSHALVSTMLKPSTTPSMRDFANADEIQARLHEITTRHYRQHGSLPLTPEDLFTMLSRAGVKLVHTKPGAAKWINPDSVRDLNSVIFTIRNDQKYKFCTEILPLLYGGLLELYGDREGSRRMGHTHNITLTDLFFRQAWNLQHDLHQGRTPHTDKIETTISAMADPQTIDLLKLAFFQDAYVHPMTGRKMALKPHGATLIRGLLLQRANFGPICGVEEIGLNDYKNSHDSRSSDLSGLHP